MPLYFAYGANMDVAAMAVRCPGSKPIGRGRLPRHRFIITQDGFASVVRDPRREVHGVLWDAGLADIRTLDKFEEVDRGLYVKIAQSIIVEGGARRALVYVGCSGFVGKPKPGYLEAVLASAEHWQFPAPYIDEMARFLGKPREKGSVAPAPVAAKPAVTPRAERPVTTLGAPEQRASTWRWGKD
jgi:gamma-glutamylcyclotransferase (GGCT)/AIG2-like uncharacterized protein YtfP